LKDLMKISTDTVDRLFVSGDNGIDFDPGD